MDVSLTLRTRFGCLDWRLRIFFRDIFRQRRVIRASSAIVRRGVGEINTDEWCLSKTYTELKHWHSKEANAGDIVDTAFLFLGWGPYWHFTPIQERGPLEKLATRVATLNPEDILEIGTAHGGSLYVLGRAGEPEQMVSIDLPDPPYDPKVPLFERFTGFPTECVRANSHQQEASNLIEEAFDGTQLEFLFIDGDHSYKGVKEDFENFAPQVAEGGIVALDDIHNTNAGVARFWSELEENYRTDVIEGSSPAADIGLVLLS